VELEDWEYARSSRGEPYVVKEAGKLSISADAAAKMENAMQRVSSGTSNAGESSLIRNGVYELRFQQDKRWYRVLWGRKDGQYVALVLLAKKQNKIDPRAVALAEKRLREHS